MPNPAVDEGKEAVRYSLAVVQMPVNVGLQLPAMLNLQVLKAVDRTRLDQAAIEAVVEQLDQMKAEYAALLEESAGE